MHVGFGHPLIPFIDSPAEPLDLLGYESIYVGVEIYAWFIVCLQKYLKRPDGLSCYRAGLFSATQQFHQSMRLHRCSSVSWKWSVDFISCITLHFSALSPMEYFLRILLVARLSSSKIYHYDQFLYNQGNCPRLQMGFRCSDAVVHYLLPSSNCLSRADDSVPQNFHI